MKYKVTFLDYWHIGSGISGGSRVDSTVLKDENNLPFIPGKTIKGLIREMAEEVFGEKSEFVIEYFGDEETKIGKAYFSNCYLDENTQKGIIANKLSNNLYEIIASTKIAENGIAEDYSLREIEVTIPLTLYGEIKNIDDKKDEFKKLLKMVKRMGLNRNRGLGRCEIEEVV